jgi:hypothetical protein
MVLLDNPLTRQSARIRLPLIAGVLAAVLIAIISSPASTSARRVPRRAPAQTRYSLAHGCYALRAARKPVSGGPFTMQPAALGVYLLYTPKSAYLTGQGKGSLAALSTPSSAAEWRVAGGARRGFTITNLGTGTRLAVRFVPASGCATYPEAGVDATGPNFKGASPEAAVSGTVEGHAHITAFEFFGGDWHCGAPFSPYGVPYALPASCAPDQQGTNGQVEDFIDWGGAPRPTMEGWPSFINWPSPTTLAEEGDYYTGIERAWRAGLRVMVTNLVDNEALCSIMTTRHNPCNDMAAVAIQNRDLHALQDYVDAQSGGPGKGWFRLVTDPFQARRVINQGKLAVIEGIEVSRLFGCGEQHDVPQCDESQIDDGLRQVRAMGVRTFFPVHEFDNAFGGTKMISGSQGAIVNAGNKVETGSFWQVQSCPAQDQDAEQTTVPASGALAGILNGPLATGLRGGAVPVYPPGPACNTRGMTSLGIYVIQQMIKDHLIVQTDHMDSKTADAAITIAEHEHYAGMVSAHCCSSPQLFQRIYNLGGFVNPPTQPPESLVTVWKTDRALHNPKFAFGFGWGSDENGLGDQPGPAVTKISYPFKSYDGRVTFNQEQWGKRKFNLDTDGLANYGLYADWLRELQLVGGNAVMKDMFNGAEAYLEMWERADGVPMTRCQPRLLRTSPRGIGSLRLGDTAEQALYRAGQPVSRPGRSFRYCVSGGGTAVSVFSPAGRVVLVARTSNRVVFSVGRGRTVLPGVRMALGRLYGRRFVAVAAPSELRSAARLRSDLRAAGLRV